MLFLFYIIVTLIFCLACEVPLLVTEIIDILNKKQGITPDFVVQVIGFLVQIAFFIVITMFFKFHVELVLSNSSTLDNLERQRNPNAGPNAYDVGSYENFTQVFGTNTCVWFLPIAPTNSNRANGVVWPKNQ
jgi:palmitoyltransferase ZDHHC2/15/20